MKDLTPEEKQFILDLFAKMQIQVSSPDAPAIVALVHSISEKLKGEEDAAE